MPKVHTKTKNKGGKAKSYPCGACSKPIVPGQTYFEWSFRYGGTHRQHTEHGSPKPSQLTQSKMSGVYSAIESAEENVAFATCIDDLKTALDDCKTEVESVRDEYQESIDAMISPDGAVAQECQEKIDALESFMEELESTSDNLEEYDDEPEPKEPKADNPEDVEAWKNSEPVQPEGDETAEHKEWAEREPAHSKWETDHAGWEEDRDQHFEDQRSQASNVLGNLSI